MDKKEIQKRRMMKYFIESTNEIIENEGIKNVTIRKVGDMAGYNSATIYNYFDNLNHLIFMASMKYLKSYAEDLYNYTKDSKDSLELYFDVWKCFAYHSYLEPEIYNLIFFGEYCSDRINSSMKLYYSIFPEELGEETKQFLPMFLENNIHLRDYEILKKASKDNFIKEQDLRDINEMNVLIYQGMLSRMLKKKCDYTVEEAVEKTIKYIKRTIEAYRI
ncbi:TetR/AcrR family transcriptional regulator [Hathewaya limosa]|uniref:AcrR family transcriptional regulator n=1 Tax=Hathewaya limosa TaxID=1536 RepID=A0ABU0JNA6_HATLI|nr:TetR/AcrR family transcriptional regulator [Hathewaya limosa]AWZ49179.1 TetR/AcrR family transcriptional regulator [Clostridiaceae bacterium 14S0207]MDQ0478544.1 AcrR family transcriptional regulator [Hathewaya limosa]